MFWRTPIRLIGLSRHTSTYLNWLLRSAKAERSKRATSMPLEPIRKDRSALAERKMYLHTARATPCGDGWAKHLRQFGGVARALAFGLIDLRCLFLRGVNLCCRPRLVSDKTGGDNTQTLVITLRVCLLERVRCYGVPYWLFVQYLVIVSSVSLQYL